MGSGGELPIDDLCSHAAVVLGDHVHVLGGESDADAYVDLHARYSPDTNVWEALAPLPTARHMLATVVLNNKIYAIGTRAIFSGTFYILRIEADR